MELTIDQALQQGVAAHKEGKLQDAERLYRAILEAQDNHPDANHNLGVLTLAVGKPLEAIPLFKLALEANPQIEQFWLSYLDALIKAECFDDAKRVLVEGERSVLSSCKLDTLKKRLRERAPNDANKTATGQMLSKSSKKLADRKKSKKRKARGVSSSASPSQDQISRLLEQYHAGRLEEAEALAALLTQRFPRHPFGWKVLGAVFKQTGRLRKSLAPMQSAVKLSPRDAEAHYNLGNTHKELATLDNAEESYRQAISLKPDYVKAHNNLGILLQEQGRLEEAEASFRQAIALKPDYAEAHRNLATMKTFSSEDEQCSQMQLLYRDPTLSDQNRCHICFALAKAYDDLDDCATAFQFYADGNALRKKELGYNKVQDEQLFKSLKENYKQITAHALGPQIGAPQVAPIFIVGMLRSGTTLVEQIISSHPLVTGAGEQDLASRFGSSLAVDQTQVNGEALTIFREGYLNALKQRSEGKAIVIDKMPQNFCFLGLIAAALPEAKIIHVKRDPAAVCWANYTQYFVKNSLGYCYSLDDILHYQELYQDLMRYWHQALPNRIYDLDYEVLTEHQEEETRKLIDHLELNWDDACLSPQENTRRVATASNVQVRKKVYQGSSQRWQRYRAFLNGALDHLNGNHQ